LPGSANPRPAAKYCGGNVAHNPEVVRTLWATLDRHPGMPWPPPPEDFDRLMRTDLWDEQFEVRTVPEFPVAGEYHGHEGVRQWGPRSGRWFSEFHNELEELIEVGGGDTIVSVQKTHGTHEAHRTRDALPVGSCLDAQGREGRSGPRMRDEGPSPRSHRAVGVGDVGGERGDGAVGPVLQQCCSRSSKASRLAGSQTTHAWGQLDVSRDQVTSERRPVFTS
jgi:hypothetical protein